MLASLKYGFAFILLVITLLHSTFPLSAQSSVGGVWVGGYEIEGRYHFILLNLTSRGTVLEGSADIREFALEGVPVTRGELTGEQSAFVLALPNGEVQFTGTLTSNRLSGRILQGTMEGTFTFVPLVSVPATALQSYVGNYQVGGREFLVWRVGSALNYLENSRLVGLFSIGTDTFLSREGEILRFRRTASGEISGVALQANQGNEVTGEKATLYQEEVVTFPNGDTQLAGTLLVPLTPGPHPAIVFTHAAGRPERELYRHWADGFARRGIAVLIFDKQGQGESTGSPTESIVVAANEALAAVRYLQQQPMIIPMEIGLWGQSRAGWSLPLAAARSKEVAFVIAVSASALPVYQQEAYRQLHYIQHEGLNGQGAETALRAVNLIYDFNRTFKYGTLETDFDALPYWRQVNQPVLAIYGALDKSVPAAESANLIADALQTNGNQEYRITIFPTADHDIIQSRQGFVEDRLYPWTYAPDYLDLMTSWVQAHTGATETSTAPTLPSQFPAQLSVRELSVLPWYGTAPIQILLVTGFLLVFSATLVRSVLLFIRRTGIPVIPSRRLPLLSVVLIPLVSVTNLVILGGFGQMMIFADQEAWSALQAILTPLTWGGGVSIIATVILLFSLVISWRASRPGRMQWLFLGTALLFIPFLLYWNFLPITP
jgi:dienelactone hydrolase